MAAPAAQTPPNTQTTTVPTGQAATIQSNATFTVKITTPAATLMIDTTPAMPAATFAAALEPATVDVTKATFRWYLELTFAEHGRSDRHRVPDSGTVDVKGKGEWTPNWGGLLAGGEVKVFVTATVDGLTGEAKHDQSYQIRGTNPSRADVAAEAGSDEARAVCWQESTMRQFGAGGTPVFGGPNGWGLMQHDPPRSESDLWHWRTNLQGGVAYLATLFGEARQYLRVHYNADKKKGTDWGWDPGASANDNKVWDDAFARYNSGRPLYAPNGNGGQPNAAQPGAGYVGIIRGHIAAKPW